MLLLRKHNELKMYISSSDPTNFIMKRQVQYLPDFTLTKLTENQRITFFILYLVIFSLSMIANVATLFTTYQRKIRLVQKTLIISLALSDIVVCIFFGVTNMVNFSHPMVNWILGDFMCSFVPCMQIAGSVANSITMVSIAFDRYRTIVHPINKQWNPNIWSCIFLLIVIWGIAAGVSYPMFISMLLSPVTVVITSPHNSSKPLDTVDLYLCTTTDKHDQLIFYSIMFSLIFLPLMVLFLWMYYKIAQLIWSRRKPLKAKTNDNNSITMETSTDSKTSSAKPSPVALQVHKRLKSVIKSSKLHMEKKIRTFKIILVIMVVFFICRIPHWLYNVIKFSKNVDMPYHWVMGNAFSCLLILNTALNPFLYSFLNQTIMYFDKFFISVGEFISNICCCCCTNTDFDDYENNSFPPEAYDPRPSQTSSIVPRGPYIDHHVKFSEMPSVKIYPKENSTDNINSYTF